MVPELLAAGGVGALGCSAAAVWRGATAVRSQVLAPSLWRVSAATRRIALTFDDGPSEGTPAVLDLLRAHGVRATFFVCGANVERLPGVARAVLKAGHELGNHTYGHARLCPRLGWKMNLRTPGEVAAEIARAQDAIERHTGVRARFFRAPYGLRWFGVRAAQRQMGLRGVTWSVIGHDWEWGAEQIAAHLLQEVRPGGIVCLHDGRDIQPRVDVSATLTALEAVLPQWRAAGLQVGTVKELLQSGAAETRPPHAYLRALR